MQGFFCRWVRRSNVTEGQKGRFVPVCAHWEVRPESRRHRPRTRPALSGPSPERSRRACLLRVAARDLLGAGVDRGCRYVQGGGELGDVGEGDVALSHRGAVDRP